MGAPSGRVMGASRLLAWGTLTLGLLALFPGTVASQGRPELTIRRAGSAQVTVPIETDAGYDAVPITTLRLLGWSVRDGAPRASSTAPDGSVVLLWAGSAFFRWKGRVLQLADVAYRSGEGLMVPLQLLTDFVPHWYPDRYALDTASLTLRVSEPPADTAASVASGRRAASGSRAGSGRAVDSGRGTARRRAPAPAEGKKVVVIDAGHGGIDPGAMSTSGIKEKTVALAIARDLQRILSKDSTLEVHMVRTDDHLIPLWSRGAEATKWKGQRPGLFISIHCNSYSSSSRGFETYFLSEARTDHERRVTANENAPLQLETDTPPSEDLDYILHELRNLDYQHWSALFAQMAQNELAKVHPGPNRGVKQGPLAVITNALMPAVLVEVGYLSNPTEARLLSTSAFQKKAAGALAEAVHDFFLRYPPGSERSGAGERR